ncbi:hypothetical protein FNL49_00235 [Klebsiella michiganensis]|nr:hypothetical protein FNL49_00235 [Klebsiella michiganensis]TRW42233.1 hypothetical protein FNL50_00235 [Klebsiella michiganensis]
MLRTALTSRTSACGRLNSTLLVPSLGLAPKGPAQALFKIAPGNFVLSRFASGRHPWRPDLVFGPPVRRFQRGQGIAASHVVSEISPLLYETLPEAALNAPVRATDYRQSAAR